MSLTYRMDVEGDAAEIMRFWSRESGWGEIDSETRWWREIVNPPFGRMRWALAINSETSKIAGLVGFVSWQAQAGGRTIRVVRPFGAILGEGAGHQLHRGNPLKNPFWQLYLTGVRRFRDEGYQLACAIPDPRWARLLRLFPQLQTRSFPLKSRPLPMTGPPALPPGHRAELLEVWDEHVDRLWRSFAGRMSCAFDRSARSLAWKVGRGDYVVQRILRGADLVALVASREKGNQQWLIGDLMSVNDGEALRAALAAVCRLAHDKAIADDRAKPLRKIAILATPHMEAALDEFGFRADDYKFSFVIHVLDPELEKKLVDPKEWYISATD